LKQGKPRREKDLGFLNLHEGQLAIADRDLPHQPPGRPKGSTSYLADAPKRICDVNKNFKQLSDAFYNRAAALKDRCNREEQNEPDTAIIKLPGTQTTHGSGTSALLLSPAAEDRHMRFQEIAPHGMQLHGFLWRRSLQDRVTPPLQRSAMPASSKH
jgi:hypothetical protein